MTHAMFVTKHHVLLDPLLRDSCERKTLAKQQTENNESSIWEIMNEQSFVGYNFYFNFRFYKNILVGLSSKERMV